MFNIKYIYGFLTTIISLIIFINTFIKESNIIKKFPKNKKVSLFFHSLTFYFIIFLHFFNVYFNIYIKDSIFLILYALGVLSVLVGCCLGNYVLLDGPTIYINYIQAIFIISIRLIINIYNIIYNNNRQDDKLNTIIMLNSQPLTRFFSYIIQKTFNDNYNNKEKSKISNSVAQAIIVIGTVPIIFEYNKSTLSILMLFTFSILCLTFRHIIKGRNNILNYLRILTKY